MSFNIQEIRDRRAIARAKGINAAARKGDLLAKLNRVGEDIAQAEADTAQAKRDEKVAKEDEARQARLRESQAAYLEQEDRRRTGLDHTELEQFIWYDGLMPHQLEGIEFGAAVRRWVLGDEPGLGKTRTSIGWMDAVKAKKVIIVAPNEIGEQFANEIRDIAPHRKIIELIKVPPAIREARQAEMLASDEAVVVLNYEALRGVKTAMMGDLLAWRADTMIVDEAHMMKNTDTANFKLVQKLISLDLYCGKCRHEVPGLVTQGKNAAGKPAGPKILVPCPHCGWKKGEPSGHTFTTKMAEIEHTRSVKNVALLTGTPLLNAPDELFALFHLARPDLFGNIADFRRTFTYANGAGHRFFTQKGLENLRIMIAPLYIARKKSDAGIQLPDREIKDVLVPINYSEYPQQRTIIDQIRKFSQIVLDSGQKLNIMEQLAQLTRQRQANVFPGGIEVTDTDPATGETRILFTTAHDIDEAAKMDSVSEHIEAHRGQRQVVFSQFTTALAEFEQRLKREGHRVIRLDGSTSKTMRSAIKTNFYKAKGEAAKWDIVLVNYKTGGAGLNLTSCTVTHVLDSEWNPGNEEQALHRTYRIGQDEETLVYRYLVPASVDTRIEAIKRRKRAIVEAFESGEIKSLKFDKGAEVAEALAAI